MPPLSLQRSVSPAPGMWICDALCRLHFLSSSTPLCTRPSPKPAIGKRLSNEQTPEGPAHPIPRASKEEVRGQTQGNPTFFSKASLMGFVAAMGGRSRKDKGIPEGGRRGRLHNWKFSHRSPDFKLFLKYLRIWQPRACISPWQRQLVLSGPGDWTCALHFAKDRSSGLPISSPPHSFTSLPSWASESAKPGLRDLMSRKSFKGHGDRSICLVSLQLQRVRPRSPPSNSYGCCRVCGASHVHTNRLAVLGSGFKWREGSKTPQFGQGERSSLRGPPAGGDSPCCAFSAAGSRAERVSPGPPGLQLLENNPSVLLGPGMILCPRHFSLG